MKENNKILQLIYVAWRERWTDSPVGHQHKKGKATQANQHTKQSMFVFTNIL